MTEREAQLSETIDKVVNGTARFGYRVTLATLVSNSRTASTENDPAEVRAWRNFLDTAPAAVHNISAEAAEKQREINTLTGQLRHVVDHLKQGAHQKIADAEMRVNEATTAMDHYPIADAYFADFASKPIQIVHTDADGRFTFTYPRGREFAIFARSGAAIWLVNAPLDQDTARISLSNSSLIQADPDRFLKTKVKDSL